MREAREDAGATLGLGQITAEGPGNSPALLLEDDGMDGRRYSARSVIAGSRRAARHAGPQHATAATPSRSATTAPYVTGSSGGSSKRSAASERPAAHAST